MASQVDASFPADNAKVPKAIMREQFRVIKEEITALQLRTNVPGMQAFDDKPTFADVQQIVNLNITRLNKVPYQIAVGLISL